MDEVFLKKLIVCTKARRGKGTTESPIRVITEIFDTNGILIAEKDPFELTIESVIDFINYRFKGTEHERVKKWAIEYFVFEYEDNEKENNS